MTSARLRMWIVPAVMFHAVVCAAVWRVTVPMPEAVSEPVTLHLLPALAGRSGASRVMPDPELRPRPVARPHLQPPPLVRAPAALMPGPFPMDEAQLQTLLAQPVVPFPDPPAEALTGADRVPILRREPPPPVLP